MVFYFDFHFKEQQIKHLDNVTNTGAQLSLVYYLFKVLNRELFNFLLALQIEK